MAFINFIKFVYVLPWKILGIMSLRSPWITQQIGKMIENFNARNSLTWRIEGKRAKADFETEVLNFALNMICAQF